eukprot:sb/3478639/
MTSPMWLLVVVVCGYWNVVTGQDDNTARIHAPGYCMMYGQGDASTINPQVFMLFEYTLLSFFKKRFRKKLFYKKLLKCNSQNSGAPQQNKTPLTCLVS